MKTYEIINSQFLPHHEGVGFLAHRNETFCGIYVIRNITNSRIYIGSSINFLRRKQEHLVLLRANAHGNPYLQADYNKCGEDSFNFEQLELVSDSENLLVCEQKYLNQWFDNQQNCYNICPKADRPPSQKGKPIHPNTLQRLLDPAKNPFAISGKEHPKAGKPMSESAKEAIRQAQLNHQRTPEHSQRIATALTGRSLDPTTISKFKDGRRKGINNAHAKQVAQYSLIGDLIKIWDLMSLAAQETNTRLSSISSCCSGKYKSAGGYVWKLVEPDSTN